MTEAIDLLALGLFCAGALWAYKIPESEKKPMRTATAATTELVYSGYWFDQMVGTLVIHVSYRQEHDLQLDGHYHGLPRLTGIRVIHARLLDWNDRWHDAGPIELRQIDRAVRGCQATVRELQWLLEHEVG